MTQDQSILTNLNKDEARSSMVCHDQPWLTKIDQDQTIYTQLIKKRSTLV